MYELDTETKQEPSYFVLISQEDTDSQPHSEDQDSGFDKEWLLQPDLFLPVEAFTLLIRNVWDIDDEEGFYGLLNA